MFGRLVQRRRKCDHAHLPLPKCDDAHLTTRSDGLMLGVLMTAVGSPSGIEKRSLSALTR